MSEAVKVYDPPKVNPLDGWHGDVHIHAPAIAMEMERRPTFEHWPKLKYWPRKKRRQFATCCNCWMDPSDTVTGGFFQDWYGWKFKTECAPDKGCNANPRRRIGKHLREAA